MKTELKNRVLWFDGTCEVTAEHVPEMFLLGLQPDQLVVRAPNDDVLLFDSMSDLPLYSDKKENNNLPFCWNVPVGYLEIELDEYFQKILVTYDKPYQDRALAELQEVKTRGLENLFKTLIYVTDTFEQNNTVWGVGRGSSCASLLLFLIGLHKVDPIKFNIPMSEFFHD